MDPAATGKYLPKNRERNPPPTPAVSDSNINRANRPPSATKRSLIGGAVVEQASAAARRSENVEKRADRRRLSGSIRSENAEHLVLLGGRREVLDPSNVAVVLRETGELTPGPSPGAVALAACVLDGRRSDDATVR
ncbi:hypothetical protein J2751_000562 [Halorubrum alkaliphilum]|uniref:Uncharacterized protein n=1 Tax=Halorubrum alkaliphilum TaxID=261290 RepID=A0A8T4GCX1_9EURY|nr:hypothetical protein [Halorubrum alkaliphilum]